MDFTSHFELGGYEDTLPLIIRKGATTQITALVDTGSSRLSHTVKHIDLDENGIATLYPTEEQIRQIIANGGGNITIYASEIPGARDVDNKMSEARRRVDWEDMYACAIDPDKARQYRESVAVENEFTCSMCGKMCAMRTVNTVLEGRELGL